MCAALGRTLLLGYLPVATDEIVDSNEPTRGAPDAADVLGTITTPDLLTEPDGIYYVEDQHAYFSVGARIKHLYTTLGCAPAESGQNPFEAEAMALWDAHLQWEAYVGTAPEDVAMRKMPHIRTIGTVAYEVPGDPDPEVIRTEAKVPDRITIYRGMHDVWDGTVQYPLATGLLILRAHRRRATPA